MFKFNFNAIHCQADSLILQAENDIAPVWELRVCETVYQSAQSEPESASPSMRTREQWKVPGWISNIDCYYPKTLYNKLVFIFSYLQENNRIYF